MVIIRFVLLRVILVILFILIFLFIFILLIREFLNFFSRRFFDPFVFLDPFVSLDPVGFLIFFKTINFFHFLLLFIRNNFPPIFLPILSLSFFKLLLLLNDLDFFIFVLDNLHLVPLSKSVHPLVRFDGRSQPSRGRLSLLHLRYINGFYYYKDIVLEAGHISQLFDPQWHFLSLQLVPLLFVPPLVPLANLPAHVNHMVVISYIFFSRIILVSILIANFGASAFCGFEGKSVSVIIKGAGSNFFVPFTGFYSKEGLLIVIILFVKNVQIFTSLYVEKGGFLIFGFLEGHLSQVLAPSIFLLLATLLGLVCSLLRPLPKGQVELA